MNLSIRFPNISAYFEGMNKSFTVFGFEITVYGILVAVGMLLGLAVIMLQVRKHKENPNLYLGMVLVSLIGGVDWLVRDCIILHFRGRFSAESHGQSSLISVGADLQYMVGSLVVHWLDLFTVRYVKFLLGKWQILSV